MSQAPARFYRNNPCCGGAPVWIDPTDPSLNLYSNNLVVGVVDTLTPAEQDVIRAISLLGVPSTQNPDITFGTGPNNPPHADATRAYLEEMRLRQIDLSDVMAGKTGPGTLNIRAVLGMSSLNDALTRQGMHPTGFGPYRGEILFCEECGKDELQQFGSDMSTLGQSMIPVVQAVALIASYVPVFGTAISFVLNTAANLAAGEKLAAATLDAIGEAIPGQPISGMAFKAAVAIIEGDSVNSVIINAMPEPPTSPLIKQGLISATNVLLDVANGHTITNAALDELGRNLPPRAAQVLDIARRLANGENVAYVAVDVLGQEAANAMTHAAVLAQQAGPAAVNQFASEAAFQAVMDTLPQALRDGFKTGFTLAIAKKLQDARESQGFTTAETNVAVNSSFVAQGQQLVTEGAKYKGALVSDLLKRPSFTVTVSTFDPLANVMRPPADVTMVIDSLWLRGFLTAMGACNGQTVDSLAQQQVRASLVDQHAQAGFDAGQAVQFWRSVNETHYVAPQAAKANLAKVASLKLSPALLANQPRTAAPAKVATPVIAAPRIAPITMPVDVYAQKTADRKRWVNYYKQLA